MMLLEHRRIALHGCPHGLKLLVLIVLVEAEAPAQRFVLALCEPVSQRAGGKVHLAEALKLCQR